MLLLRRQRQHDHVVIAAATSAANGLAPTQRSVVMFDDGSFMFMTETNSEFVCTSQIRAVAFNAQIRLLGLFDRWLLLCDGSSLRLFDCGNRTVVPTAAAAISSLLLDFPAVQVASRASNQSRMQFDNYSIETQHLVSSVALPPVQSISDDGNEHVVVEQTISAQPVSRQHHDASDFTMEPSPRSLASPRPQTAGQRTSSPIAATGHVLPQSSANESEEHLQVIPAEHQCIAIA